MICNAGQLEAHVFHGLKSLLSAGDTLPPRYLEIIVCQAFGLQHVGDGNFFADGINNIVQASVKTRMLNPEVLKRTHSGRDFTTHPEKFLGPKENKKQGKISAGLEFVQRRQEIDNEHTASPLRIGRKTLCGFLKNIKESKNKFNIDTTYEILVIHGYNWRHNAYLVNMYWQELKLPKLTEITWVKNTNGVDGLVTINNKPQIVMHRVRGGAPREATCFKEYKDPTKYQHSVSISVPIPEPWPFDQEQILAEIKHLKETQNGPFLFEE